MRGKTVSSGDVIFATDKTVKAGEKSKIVNLTLNKRDGKPSSNSSVLNELEMENYLKYAVKISENCINEIMSGYATPAPYENACNYCQYGGMCGFCSSEGGEFRKVSKVDSSTIVGAVNLAEKTEQKADNGNEN
jgi:ATP-dependent helicase/DNAse subunit B